MSPSNLLQQSTSNGHHHHHQPSFPPSTIASSSSVFSRMPLEDVLEDLASRFILNLPIVELSQIERVCFQVEQAHWFYEDFVRPNSLLNLPSYHLKTFTGLFFEKCEFLTIEGAPLAGWDPKTAYEKFMRYKERVPVCGAIMFNEDATQVLLVRGFKSNSSWSFPRGKINENELPRDCAIREVLEETGFNIQPYLSLSSLWSDDSKQSAIRKARPSNPTPSGQNNPSTKTNQSSTLQSEDDDHFIELTIREQRLRMYLVVGIPNDTNFVTQTRQEIGRIAWFPLSELPTFTASTGTLGSKQLSKMINVSYPTTVESHGHQPVHAKFYMVVPFVNDMRTWLSNHNLLTPVGQPSMTPRALDHQSPYAPTPPHIPGIQNHHGHVMTHFHRQTQGFINEAAAVQHRANRLQAFDFSLDDNTITHSSSEDTRLPSHSKKKKKRQQQRRTPKLASHVQPIDNYSYLSDQAASMDDEDMNANETPWNDLEEGTRALQNFFFGTPSVEAEAEDGENQENITYDSSFVDAVGQQKVNFQALNSTSQTNTEPDGPRREEIQSVHVPQRNADSHVHYQVKRELKEQINLQIDTEEPLSEADTDVVKGYDLATSYASSMSSSYRGPSTQIPSSDEQNSANQSGTLNQSANFFSELSNMPANPAPANEAEAMYSKHGHLAAPRPQAAPQQVERLLAMLQAPTPGPTTAILFKRTCLNS